jgi:hypothetical protein
VLLSSAAGIDLDFKLLRQLPPALLACCTRYLEQVQLKVRVQLSKRLVETSSTAAMFELLIVTSRKSAQLSYLGGAGVEGGQGSNDYNYGDSLPLINLSFTSTRQCI